MDSVSGTPPRKLGKDDAVKIAKGAAIAMAGALVVYLADVVMPSLMDSEFAQTTLFVVASTIINALRKWFTDTRVISLLLGLFLLPASGFAQARLMDPAKALHRE